MKNDLWMLKYARDFLVFTAILFHVVCVCVCVACQDVFRPLVRISEALLGSSLSMWCHLAENSELGKTTVSVCYCIALFIHYSSEMEATSTSMGSTTHILRFSLSK